MNTLLCKAFTALRLTRGINSERVLEARQLPAQRKLLEIAFEVAVEVMSAMTGISSGVLVVFPLALFDEPTARITYDNTWRRLTVKSRSAENLFRSRPLPFSVTKQFPTNSISSIAPNSMPVCEK